MNILEIAKGLKNQMSMRPVEMGGYGLQDWLVSAVFFQALQNKETVFYRNIRGFIDGNQNDLVMKMFPENFRVLDGEGLNIYTTDNSIMQFGSSWPEAHEIEESEDKNVSRSIETCIFSCSKSEMEIFEKMAKENITEDKKNTIYALSQMEMGLQLLPIGNIKSPLIEENYEDGIIDDYLHIVKNFNKPSPQGRLVIMHGEAGTGKTHLVKALINDLTNCTAVVLPAKLVPEIDGPSLIPLFVRHKMGKKKPIVMVIEDADACLAPRGTDNISAISTLLNNTDGILGTILDLRIVATTNQPRLEFDRALMRPGRLCRNVGVGLLDAEKCNKIYRRLSEKNENKYESGQGPFSLAEVYADACGSEIKQEKEDKLGFV